jgi:hypothetical protein
MQWVKMQENGKRRHDITREEADGAIIGGQFYPLEMVLLMEENDNAIIELAIMLDSAIPQGGTIRAAENSLAKISPLSLSGNGKKNSTTSITEIFARAVADGRITAEDVPFRWRVSDYESE